MSHQMSHSLSDQIHYFSNVDCRTDQSIEELKSFIEQHFINKNYSETYRQRLWQIFQRFESCASNANSIEILKTLRSSVSCFTNKQKKKSSASTRSSKSSISFSPCSGFIPYNGSDDIDRYLGHGEWDTSQGYYCTD